MAGSPLCFFEDQACDMILQACDLAQLIHCVHPAVFALQEYDAEYHTEYIPTLELYLRLERLSLTDDN